MLKRIVTAIAILAVLFGCVFGLRSVYFQLADILTVLVFLGVFEMYQAFKRAGYRPIPSALILGCVAAFPLTYFFMADGVMLTLAVTVVAALIVFTLKHNLGEAKPQTEEEGGESAGSVKKGYSLNDMFATVFIGIYPLSLFMLFLPVNHSEAGLLGIMLVIAVPVMTDTMAYFTGMALGKRKLCPQISPKKTVAGAVGGVIGGIIGALIVFFLFDFSSAMSVFPNAGSMELIPGNLYGSLGLYIALGIVGGVLSELGDLAASWIKRKAGIKDFGKIFPGHGGIMDRLDSILFMLPLVYLVFAVSGIC
ncbi:MAG TPA: phosphatidate cytidylyltransferase [Firmicutes bacterium]|nr:phosphatidate cytidylyltransferase [Bacillota bacterium]